MPALPVVEIFTDGACSGNPGPGGWGAILRYGDTGEAPQDPGAGGSRVTHVIGQAALDGGQRMKATLEDLAAEAFGWPAGEVRLSDDRFVSGQAPVRKSRGGVWRGPPGAQGRSGRRTRSSAGESAPCGSSRPGTRTRSRSSGG